MAAIRSTAIRAALSRNLPVSLLVSALGLAATGCPSPDVEGRYDGFVEQTQDIRDDAASQKLDVGGALADVTGTFHFSLAAIIAAETPLQFIATTTFTPTDDGGTLDMVLQPLSLDPGATTEPREFVGETVMLSFPVTAEGAFDADLGEVAVTGAANPITGSDIVATLMLTGAIQDENVFCGVVGGMVTVPANIDLTGSTFAAVRIEDTAPGSLPTELVAACPAGGGGGGGSDTDGGDTDDSATGG